MPKSPHLIESLASYSLLGRSGLRVSPLCLGAMTFGTEWGWGAAEDESVRMLDHYIEAGGNFIDTAYSYTQGTSEKIIGRWMKERCNRDRVVLASKFKFNNTPGDPNAGGNGRKNMMRALEGSLARLETDFLDVYWLHAWDSLTPVDEVMRGLDDVVRAGKVRHIGFSDVPAWYFARAQTLAELRGWTRVIGLQLEYSLLERNIEREHVPAALELGAGITPWAPLASGLLAGKHKRGAAPGTVDGQGRLKSFENSKHPSYRKLFAERTWPIVDAVVAVAAEMGKLPAQVAINWITKRPGVTSTIVGASRLDQLEQNLQSLSFEIPAALSQKLEEASRIEVVNPYMFSLPVIQRMMNGGTTLAAEPAWFRPGR